MCVLQLVLYSGYCGILYLLWVFFSVSFLNFCLIYIPSGGTHTSKSEPQSPVCLTSVSAQYCPQARYTSLAQLGQLLMYEHKHSNAT